MRHAPDDFPPPAPAPDPTTRDHRYEYDYAHPWRRQPCDTDTYWALFKRYLYQVPPRRFRDRQSAHDFRVFVECKWEERAQAWDESGAAEEERLARTAQQRHLRRYDRAGRVGDLAIRALEREVSVPGYVGGALRPRDALAFVVRGTEGERRILGLDKGQGEILPGQGTAPGPLDTARLSPEELDTLRALLVKAGVQP